MEEILVVVSFIHTNIIIVFVVVGITINGSQ